MFLNTLASGGYQLFTTRPARLLTYVFSQGLMLYPMQAGLSEKAIGLLPMLNNPPSIRKWQM